MTPEARKAMGRHQRPADTTTTIRSLEEVLAQLPGDCRPSAEEAEARVAELWATGLFLIAEPGDVEVGNLERVRESFARMNRLKGKRGGAFHLPSHSPSFSLFRSPYLTNARAHTRQGEETEISKNRETERPRGDDEGMVRG